MSQWSSFKGVAGALACALLFVAPFAGSARAQLSSEKTVVTFNAPVEIPGHILAPGTYVFARTQQTIANPDVVQVYDSTGQGLIATVLCRASLIGMGADVVPPDQPMVQMEETAPGAMPRVHGFVARGSLYVHEFLYRDSESR